MPASVIHPPHHSGKFVNPIKPQTTDVVGNKKTIDAVAATSIPGSERRFFDVPNIAKTTADRLGSKYSGSG